MLRRKVVLLIALVVGAGWGGLIRIPAVYSGQHGMSSIKITSPENGTVVAPGATIDVVATPGANSAFTHVVIIGQDPIGFSEIKTDPPFVIRVTIPTKIRLGRYSLTASGVSRPGKGAESPAISINVEKSEALVNLLVKPSMMKLQRFGDQMPLKVQGTFTDNETVTITESMFMEYDSSDSNVATVDSQGLVRAVGEGTAAISVSYKGRSVSVPVEVQFERQSINIDIDPKTRRNGVKFGSRGHLDVAILSSPAFSAATVDDKSVRFGPAGASPRGRAKMRDVNKDGDRDLILRFSLRETGFECFQKTATLTGATLDGILITGSDAVRLRGKNCIESRHRWHHRRHKKKESRNMRKRDGWHNDRRHDRD